MGFIHDAAKEGNLDVLKFLIENGVKVNEKNEDGATPLMLAVQNEIEVAKFLIEKGAKIDEKTNDGWTPLMFAARQGRIKVVEMLLENGAKIDEKTKYGDNTAYDLAQNEEIKKLLKPSSNIHVLEIDGKKIKVTFEKVIE